MLTGSKKISVDYNGSCNVFFLNTFYLQTNFHEMSVTSIRIFERTYKICVNV